MSDLFGGCAAAQCASGAEDEVFGAGAAPRALHDGLQLLTRR